MASSLNKVMLIGNLGKDAETRHTPGGTSVTKFTLATTYRSKDQNSGDWKERTDWHNVVLWRGDRVANYLKKGKKVFVEGRLQTSSWEDQQGNKRYRTEVICDNFGLMLLGGREGGSDYGGGQGGYGAGASHESAGADRGPEPTPVSPSGSGQTGGSESSAGGNDSSWSSGTPDDDIPF